MKKHCEVYRMNFYLLIVVTFMTAFTLGTPSNGVCIEKQTQQKSATVDVRILAINDFHGQLTERRDVSGRPVGGAPVLASYLLAASDGMKDRAFIVHVGDLVGASPPESSLLQDEPSVMFFNMLANKFCTYKNRMHQKCNIVGTVGNHEFDEGYDEMMRLVMGGNHVNGPYLEDPWKGAVFPYVCANVVSEDTGLPILPPYVVKEVDEVPLAFVGAVLENTSTIVTASGIKGLAFLEEARAINEQVEILKSKGIQTIIALIHQGGSQKPYGGPTDPGAGPVSGDIVNIVKALDSEVDVVISGHWHKFTNALIKNNEGSDILVTQAFWKGTAYADIDLKIDRHTLDVVAKSAEIITTWADKGPGLKPHVQVSKLVKKAEEAVEPLTGRVIAQAAAAVGMTGNDAGESALGDLVADSQRAAMGTDFAFLNPGSIRSDMDAGEVTWGELYMIQPFNDHLIKMELTGEQIYELLNQQWSGQPFPRVLQISGLHYTWDAAMPENDRIIEIRKDGNPIEKASMYTVTVNSFLAGGGDRFTVLLGGANQEVGPIDLDALIAYIQSLQQPFTYPLKNRITKIN